jgi:hypothetical protein
MPIAAMPTWWPSVPGLAHLEQPTLNLTETREARLFFSGGLRGRARDGGGGLRRAYRWLRAVTASVARAGIDGADTHSKGALNE